MQIPAGNLNLAPVFGTMTSFTVSPTYQNGATYTIPATGKYLIVASFSTTHLASGNSRDYTYAIRKDGTELSTSSVTGMAGSWLHSATAAYLGSLSNGDVIQFSAKKVTDTSGTLLATSHYAIIKIG